MRDGGVSLLVQVHPRASREGLHGVRQGALVVRLTAPPVDGAANQALTRFLARLFRVAPSAVEIAAGTAARRKRVVLHGIALASVRERLAPAEGRLAAERQ